VNGKGLAIDFRWFYTPDVVFYRPEVEITLLFLTDFDKNDIFENGEGLAYDFRWFCTPEVVFYRPEVEITLLFFDRF
jgi:hypothetical protein